MTSFETKKNPNADFGIEIDFERGSESPSRVFRSMTELIQTFAQIDEALAASIDAKIEPVVVIEDIEAGSVRAWLRYVLKAVDDDALKTLDWKRAVGGYLVKAKYLALRFTENRTEILTKEEIAQLEQELLEAAKETDVTHFPSYVPVDRPLLLDNMNRLHQALSYLTDKDRTAYVTAQNATTMNASFSIVPENIEELVTHEIISNPSAMILKVKKPDYLGESQWEFRHGTKPVIGR